LKIIHLQELLLTPVITDILEQQMRVVIGEVKTMEVILERQLKMKEDILILLLLIMQEFTLTQYLYLMMQAVEMKLVQKIFQYIILYVVVK
jgi:hypothetical protein